jgi:hypothetical protein
MREIYCYPGWFATGKATLGANRTLRSFQRRIT